MTGQIASSVVVFLRRTLRQRRGWVATKKAGCVRGYSVNYDGSWFDSADQTSRFAEPYACVVRVAVGEGLSIAKSLYDDILFKQTLTTVPALRESVTTNSCREPARPRYLTRDIGDRRAYRFITRRFNDSFVMLFAHKRLLRGPKTGSDQNTICAQHECCGEASSICDAARCKQH